MPPTQSPSNDFRLCKGNVCEFVTYATEINGDFIIENNGIENNIGKEKSITCCDYQLSYELLELSE